MLLSVFKKFGSVSTRTLLRYRTNLQRSSAIQQGVLNISIFLISLLLLSIVTYLSVQGALVERMDDGLKQKMGLLVQQQSNSDSDEQYSSEPRTLNQVNFGNEFFLVFPKRDLESKKNRIFRKEGFSNKELDHDDDHYRLLVKHEDGLVFVVAESNDNDQEIMDIVVSSFLFNGLISLFFTTLLVIYLANRSYHQIRTIEHVLKHAAQGDLKQRIGPTDKNNDLAHVSAQIDTMLARLETSMSAMTDISANIAHELKTPISRLRHDLITALDQTEQGKDAMVALNDAYEESGQITETFNALLRIAQIEGGARRAHFTTLNMNDLINTVMDIYAEVAQDSGMSLRFEVNAQAESQPPLMINGDKELLIQMMANLIENSIRYCAEGTAIVIHCVSDGEQVRLQVSDNGSGIPEADREHVFERLYQGDRSRTDKRGTGLGLSLVKAIIELHNADITLLDNEPGLLVCMGFPTVS
ncbi:sensor histidine kinase [Leucothrix arctica]|uniref:histidine kinase n=1 Tax=Leucothrix arctica TaxID=1481894 RepID=A0A317CKH3_9GAMM|nr:ATP-binding protein [Leucothrix arctica]PWQ96820.1 two-component sensor histidine kinase [Leucothrix arctica]